MLEDAVGEAGRVLQRARAGDRLEIGGLQLQRHRAAGMARRLQPVGELARESVEFLFQCAEIADVDIEGGLGRDALGLPLRADAPFVDAAGQPGEPQPLGAEAARQSGLVGGLQIGDEAVALARQALLRRLADTPDGADASGSEEGDGLFGADHREAARLVEIGGNLGEELVRRQPDGDGDADLGLDGAGEPSQRAGRALAMQALRAGKVEKRLVDGKRLDQRREAQHALADLPADSDIFRHVGLHHRRLGAERQRLEHRHGRAHALHPGEIAGGGDHAALAAADDDRHVAQGRVVALFHGGVEGVAVDMGDMQRVEFGVAGKARAAAMRAARRLTRIMQAIAAEGRCAHGVCLLSRLPCPHGRESRARPRYARVRSSPPRHRR